LQLADDYIKLKGDSSPTNYAMYLFWPNNQKWIFLNQLLLRISELTPNIVSRINKDIDPYNFP